MSMLKDLEVKLVGKYSINDLKELEEIENELKLKEFNSDIALDIGKRIIASSKKYNEDLIVKITRLSDNETIFQYIGDTKASRNIKFADMKANTTRISAHSSIYTLVKRMVEGGFQEIFEEESECLPVAGAFPLFVDEKMVAIIAVSGMHNGLDHVVIVEGLASYLNKTIKEFKGYLI